MAGIQRVLPIEIACICLLGAGGCAAPPEVQYVAREDLLEGYRRQQLQKPVLVVDIDDTLVEGGTWNSIRLFFNLFYSGLEPFPEAPQRLRELQNDWNCILLTARDDSLANRTLHWLERQGFPELPVVFSSSYLFLDSSAERFKEKAIAGLKEGGLRVDLGVGDKATDVAAYRANGLKAILILSGAGDPDLDATLEALGLEAIAPSGGGLGPLELVVLSREKAWELVQQAARRESGPPGR